MGARRRFPLGLAIASCLAAVVGLAFGGFTPAGAADDPALPAGYHPELDHLGASDAGTLPAGWAYWTFWQFADSGTIPGDQDYVNGDASRLLALANDTP